MNTKPGNIDREIELISDNVSKANVKEKHLSDKVQKKVQSFADQMKLTILSDTTSTQTRNVTSTGKKCDSRENSENRADDKFRRDPEDILQKERYQKPKKSSTHPVPCVNVKHT